MNDATVDRVVRARLGARAGSSTVAQLALLDHHMVPSDSDVTGWIAAAEAQGFDALRTSALFPESQQAFLDAGFEPLDRLSLLERVVHPADGRRRVRGRTRRMRARDVPGAAAVDRAAFGDGWGNDAASLAEIGPATPHHRSRVVGRAPVMAFAISGRAGSTGYIQRLAVDPDGQGAGLGRLLLDDALAWMVRHRVATALVNTGVDNERALGLYRSAGFRLRPDQLAVLQLALGR